MTLITDDEVRGLPLSEGRAELLEEIMATPVIDRTDASAPGPRRTPAVLAALVAAAAVIAAVALPGYLLTRHHGAVQVGSGGPVAARCWDGAPGPTCTTPHGKAGLEWAFPRLAGHLADCDPIDASGRSFADDLPMTFGTPNPGDGAAYRCSLAALGVGGADPAAPVIWVFAFGADGGKDLRDEIASPYFDAQPFSLDGEPAGRMATDDVGLVRPDGMFMAAYDDFPFAVVGYASGRDQARDYLAALGMRPPSQLAGPGDPDPTLPSFPGDVLLPPEGSDGPLP